MQFLTKNRPQSKELQRLRVFFGHSVSTSWRGKQRMKGSHNLGYIKLLTAPKSWTVLLNTDKIFYSVKQSNFKDLNLIGWWGDKVPSHVADSRRRRHSRSECSANWAQFHQHAYTQLLCTNMLWRSTSILTTIPLNSTRNRALRYVIIVSL